MSLILPEIAKGLGQAVSLQQKRNLFMWHSVTVSFKCGSELEHPQMRAMRRFRFIGCMLLSFCQAYSNHWRPCTPYISHNCTKGRFNPCGSSSREGFNLKTLHARDATRCQMQAGRLTRGQKILVQFFSGPPERNGQCMEIVLEVGECWGLDSDGDSYDCLGLCGAGCQETDVCSNWSQNCLKHDVCSYYYNARGGAADPHCGWAFNIAAADYIRPCLVDSTCTISNFNTKVEVCAKVQPGYLI